MKIKTAAILTRLWRAMVPCLLMAGTTAEARSWEPIGPDGGDRFVVEISPSSPNTLFVLGHHAIHRSRDQGENWDFVLDPEMARDSFVDMAFVTGTPALFAAGSFTGVWYSPDEGDTWESRSLGLPLRDGFRHHPVTSLVVGPSGALYASVSRGRASGSVSDLVYRSDDLGSSWIEDAAGIVAPTDEGPVLVFLSKDVSGRLWAFVSGSDVYTYENGRWLSRKGDLPGAGLQITSFANGPENHDRALLGTRESWVYETVDGGVTWERLPLPEELELLDVLPLVYTVTIDPNNPDLVVVRANDRNGSQNQPLFRPSSRQTDGAGLYISRDGGDSWYRRSAFVFRLTPDPSEVVSDDVFGTGPLRRSKTWYRTSGGVSSVSRSVDGAVTFDAKTKGIRTIWMNEIWVHPNPPAGSDGLVLAASEAGLFRMNGAGDWSHVLAAESTIFTWAFAEDPMSSDAVFYATGNPAWTTPEYRGLYRLPTACFDVECSPADRHILASPGLWLARTTPARPERIFAAGQEEGVLVSEDGGSTWAEMNDGLTSPISVTDLSLDAHGDPRFASFRTSSADPTSSPPEFWAPRHDEEGGVFEFDVAAKTWSLMSDVSVAVYELEEAPGAGGLVYAATAQGVYRFTATDGWQLVSRPVPTHDVEVDPRRPEHVYVASPWGVFRSTDGGAHWSDFSDGLPHRIVYALALDEREGTLYAALEGGSILRVSLD